MKRFPTYSFLLFIFLMTSTSQAQISHFPFAVGNRWEYHVSAIQESTDPESNQNMSVELKVIWEVTAKEEVFGRLAYRIEATQHILNGPETGRKITMEDWYTVKGDTVRGIASRGNHGEFLFNTVLFKPVVQEDEPNEWSYVSLIFPLTIGQSWNTESLILALDPGSTVTKTVAARETISVLAGEFDTFKIIHQLNGNSFTYHDEQWFSSVGLVKMMTNAEVEAGDGSTVSIVAQMELEQFHLKDSDDGESAT